MKPNLVGELRAAADLATIANNTSIADALNMAAGSICCGNVEGARIRLNACKQAATRRLSITRGAEDIIALACEAFETVHGPVGRL